MNKYVYFVLAAAIAGCIVLAGCGGSSPSPETSVGRFKGSVKLPPPKPQGSEWVTPEIERLILAQIGVRTAQCKSLDQVPAHYTQSWDCAVTTKKGSGHITILSDAKQVLSYDKNEVPGFSFGA